LVVSIGIGCCSTGFSGLWILTNTIGFQDTVWLIKDTFNGFSDTVWLIRDTINGFSDTVWLIRDTVNGFQDRLGQGIKDSKKNEVD